MRLTQEQITAYLKSSNEGAAECPKCGSLNVHWYPGDFQYVEDRDYDAECRFECSKCHAFWFEQLKTVGIMSHSAEPTQTIEIDFLRVAEGLKEAMNLVNSIPPEYKELLKKYAYQAGKKIGIDQIIKTANDEAEKVLAIVPTRKSGEDGSSEE